MAMDSEKIKIAAVRLEGLLLGYSRHDGEVTNLLNALRPLLVKAKDGRIFSPMEWRDIPGGVLFTEGLLRKYRDLEDAFAEFRIELTGGDNPILE